MQLLGEVVLVIQNFTVVSEKDGSWHGIKTDILRIIYSIFSIPGSVGRIHVNQVDRTRFRCA